MSQKVIVPYICYRFERGTLVRHCYVIWFRHLIIDQNFGFGKKVVYDFHLAYTGNDGRLHPLGYTDANNKKHNTVTLQGYTGRYYDRPHVVKYKNRGKVIKNFSSVVWWHLRISNPKNRKDSAYFHISNFKSWKDVRKDRLSHYHNPVEIPSNIMVGFTLIPGSMIMGDISINYLKRHQMIIGPWLILTPNTPVPKKKKVKAYLRLNADYSIYFRRLKSLNTRLDAKIRALARKLAYYNGCATQVEYLNDQVWSKSINHKRKGNLRYVFAEARLIRNEVINPMRRHIRSEMNYTRVHYLKTINWYSWQMVNLLENKKHHEEFLAKYRLPLKNISEYIKSAVGKGKNATVPMDTRIQYTNAYNLVSRTKHAKKLYQSHVKVFLSHFDLKEADPKKAINKAVEDFSKKAGWFNSLGSEVMTIVNMYGTLQAAGGHADDVHHAMRFLRARGLLNQKGWEDFDRDMKELKNALAVATSKGVKKAPLAPLLGEKYAGGKLPKTDLGLKALTKSLHILKVISICTTDYSQEKTLHKGISDLNSVVGIAVNYSQAQKVQKVLKQIGVSPTKVKGYGGGITTVADWAVGLHSLGTEDWKKDGSGFGIAFVSCVGKTIATIGLVVPQPAGLVLTAIGLGIELSSGAYDMIANYKSPSLEAYETQVKKIFALYRQAEGSRKRTPKVSSLETKYNILVNHSDALANKTRTYSFMKQLSFDAKYSILATRLLRTAKTQWGDKKMADVIKNFFNDDDYGIRIPLGSGADHATVRYIMQYREPIK